MIKATKDKTLSGLLATGLPLVATLLIISIIVVIIVEFLIEGGPNLSWSFITEFPREMNTKGGIWPAIYGTLFLVIIMSLAVVPIGTITAIYLTEYAKRTSLLARTVRFAVNTLAGVPSIVFGLFGLGFFIQTIGAQLDTWNWDSKVSDLRTTLSAASSPVTGTKIGTIADVQAYLKNTDSTYWNEQITTLGGFPRGTDARVNLDITSRFIASKKELKWGQPSILWAALTLALLTLPVVIVSVEESLRAVPADIRAASLALGATRWETIRRVVLPNSIGGILTGSILAVSRGAGEVAPILLTGVVYSMSELPKSLSNQFMHLGYHLYILSTQSPDVEGTRPLQYATTLVLIGLTLALNIVAILLRSYIRKRRIQA